MTNGRSLLCHADRERKSIARDYDPANEVTLYYGDCMDLLRQMPNESAALIVTSPPYNIGKAYENRVDLSTYVDQQRVVIQECVRILHNRGSLCWQVGNFVHHGEIVPLDCLLFPIFAQLGLKMRNRIVWHFEHGLHCTRRFSGRYEVVLWFTKTNDYFFDVDPVRVPQKYPEKKHFKGPKAGMLSCNPMGKNPGDIWRIPNVKHNHVEKTEHPCQFPVELIERLVLSMTQSGDLVLDPFMGTGTTAIAAIRHQRRAAGAEISTQYQKIAIRRILLEQRGELRTRPMERPIHVPDNSRASRNNRIVNQRTVGELF